MVILSKKRNKIFIVVFIVVVLLILFKQVSFRNRIISVNNEGSNYANNTINETTIVVDQTEDSASLGYSGQRKIVEDSVGNFYIAYRKKYNGYYNIFVAKLTKKENGEWEISGTNKPIADIGVTQRVPSLAIDSKNNLHIIWYGADSKKEKNNRQIKYSKSIDGGNTWKKWINISLVSGFTKKNKYWQEHPSIFVGMNNELYVVWEGKDVKNKHQQIKFSKSVNDGDTWKKWRNINVSQNSQSRPSLIQDSRGRLHLFMYSSLNGRIQQIQYSYSDDDGMGWSNWNNISNSDFDSRHVSFVIDKNNNIYVVWRSGYSANGPTQIFYTTFKNNIWADSQIVYNSNNYQFFPSISINKMNEISVAWMESIKKYNFPKEKPLSGEVISIINFLDNKNSIKIFESMDSYYPNLSNNYDDKQFPIVYTKENGDIVLKIVENFK